MVVNVLGTNYRIEYVAMKDAEEDGFCDYTSKHIVVRSDNPNEVEDLKWLQKKVLRHEIIHAFLAESGLQANFEHSNKWGHDEMMVDWIAIQFPKVHQAFVEAGAL